MRAKRKRARGQFPRLRAGLAVHVLPFILPSPLGAVNLATSASAHVPLRSSTLAHLIESDHAFAAVPPHRAIVSPKDIKTTEHRTNANKNNAQARCVRAAPQKNILMLELFKFAGVRRNADGGLFSCDTSSAL